MLKISQKLDVRDPNTLVWYPGYRILGSQVLKLS